MEHEQEQQSAVDPIRSPVSVTRRSFSHKGGAAMSALTASSAVVEAQTRSSSTSGSQKASLRALGDAWERSYGDLGWRDLIPGREMPWYFATHDGAACHGYGVKTDATALCFWQLDPEGVSLWLNVTNDGDGVIPGSRKLTMATVVPRRGAAGEAAAGARFGEKRDRARELAYDLTHPQALLDGCNTVSCLGQGIFDVQRTWDDTSGRQGERTRRMREHPGLPAASTGDVLHHRCRSGRHHGRHSLGVGSAVARLAGAEWNSHHRLSRPTCARSRAAGGASRSLFHRGRGLRGRQASRLAGGQHARALASQRPSRTTPLSLERTGRRVRILAPIEGLICGAYNSVRVDKRAPRRYNQIRCKKNALFLMGTDSSMSRNKAVILRCE